MSKKYSIEDLQALQKKIDILSGCMPKRENCEDKVEITISMRDLKNIIGALNFEINFETSINHDNRDPLSELCEYLTSILYIQERLKDD